MTCTKKGAISSNAFSLSSNHPLHPKFKKLLEPAPVKGPEVTKGTDVKGKGKAKVIVSQLYLAFQLEMLTYYFS